MKIEVTKRDLESALQVVTIAAASTGSDLTTHLVFRTQNERTEVLANNGRIGLVSPLICKSSDEGSFTVEAWRLKQWISAVEGSVLTLEYENHKVTASSPKGSVKFSSLDPEHFPYWDETFSATEKGYTMKARQLHAALNHVKMFISDKDVKRPALVVTEIKEVNGKRLLMATDKASLGVVELPVFATANFRVHGKDIPSLNAFLGASGEEDVEVREHSSRMFIIRGDGSILNVGRPAHAFPDINVSDEEDQYLVTVKVADLKSSLSALAAGASKEDTRVSFRVGKGELYVSMASASGSKDTLHMEIQDLKIKDEAPSLPDTGFDLPNTYVLKALSQTKNDTITLGVNAKLNDQGKVKSGYVRIKESRDSGVYTTVLVWLT